MKQQKWMRTLKDNTPLILSVLSGLGVIGTGILAAKNAVDAAMEMALLEDKEDREIVGMERVYKSAPYFIPSICMGTATIVCIGAGYFVNEKIRTELIATAGIWQEMLQRYREATIDIYGEEADQKIREHIVLQNPEFHKIGNDEVEHEKTKWIEDLTGAHFYAYEKELVDAFYHLNRNYMLGMAVSKALYLQFLGLDSYIQTGDEVEGWSIESGIYWIDFQTWTKIGKHGKVEYHVSPVFYPEIFSEDELEMANDTAGIYLSGNDFAMDSERVLEEDLPFN